MAFRVAPDGEIHVDSLEEALTVSERQRLDHIQRLKQGVDGTPEHAIVIIVCCVVTCGNQMLLIQRPEDHPLYPNLWMFPGGRFESKRDPSFEVTASRELFEETGVEVAPIMWETVSNRVLEHPAAAAPWVCIYLACRAPLDIAKKALNKEPHLCKNTHWVLIGGLADRLRKHELAVAMNLVPGTHLRKRTFGEAIGHLGYLADELDDNKERHVIQGFIGDVSRDEDLP